MAHEKQADPFSAEAPEGTQGSSINLTKRDGASATSPSNILLKRTSGTKSLRLLVVAVLILTTVAAFAMWFVAR